MPIKILMPALSPTMTEGNLAKWRVKEGDQVGPGDVLAEIETDKATMEVEAVDEGVIGKIVVPEGTEGVKVNEVIGLLLAEGEDKSALTGAGSTAPAPVAKAPKAEPAPAPAARAPAAAPAGSERASPLARRMASQVGVDLGSVSGSGAHGKIVARDVAARAERPNGGAAAERVPAEASGERVFASPLARRMASQAGLDLGALRGSGPEGRIVRADIEAALSAGAPQAAAQVAQASAQATQARSPAAKAPTPVAPPPPRAPAAVPGEAFTTVKMSTMRRVIAERMSASKREVPHFYMTIDCVIDELMKVRGELNKRVEPDKISVNDFVIRACALALREVPAANVSWVGDGTMRQYNVVDISVAVALDGGLITPIVRNADAKGLVQIAREMKDLAARARAGKLMPEEYQGGCFSISNLGMYGVKEFDAVINPPQACILAVGAGEQRPIVKNGQIVSATVMGITLSVDHRVVDGAVGATLLAAIKRLIEYPPAMLL
jgi:pyruvate dehydrogenase E2 component (dihydrolipoamide acetyltransferase)